MVTYDPQALEELQRRQWEAMQPTLQSGERAVRGAMARAGTLRGSPTGQTYAREYVAPVAAGIQRSLADELTRQTEFERQRPYQEAQLTGEYGGRQTMQGRSLASQLESEAMQRQYMPRQFALQEAGLTGQYGGQQTMAGQSLASQLAGERLQQQYQPQMWQSQLATEAQQREYTPQQFALQKALSEAGLTGMYGGQQTQAAQQAAQQLALQQAGLTGMYGGQQTMQGQQLAEQLANQRFQQALQAGQLTGQYGGAPTLEAQQLAFNKALQEAGLTGMYGGQQTMQGQQLADALATSGLQRQYYPSQFTGFTPEGQATMQYQAQMLPYITQGYMQAPTGFGGLGTIRTEQQLDPAWSVSQKLGFSDPYQMSLYAAQDPEGMKKMFRSVGERESQRRFWNI